MDALEEELLPFRHQWSSEATLSSKVSPEDLPSISIPTDSWPLSDFDVFMVADRLKSDTWQILTNDEDEPSFDEFHVLYEDSRHIDDSIRGDAQIDDNELMAQFATIEVGHDQPFNITEINADPTNFSISVPKEEPALYYEHSATAPFVPPIEAVFIDLTIEDDEEQDHRQDSVPLRTCAIARKWNSIGQSTQPDKLNCFSYANLRRVHVEIVSKRTFRWNTQRKSWMGPDGAQISLSHLCKEENWRWITLEVYLDGRGSTYLYWEYHERLYLSRSDGGREGPFYLTGPEMEILISQLEKERN
jgi:hypothetical protein